MSTRADGLTISSNYVQYHDRVAGIYADHDSGHPRRARFPTRAGLHGAHAADSWRWSRPSPSSNRRAPAPRRSRSLADSTNYYINNPSQLSVGDRQHPAQGGTTITSQALGLSFFGQGLAAGSSLTFSLPFSQSVRRKPPSHDHPPIHGVRPDDRRPDFHHLDQIRRISRHDHGEHTSGGGGTGRSRRLPNRSRYWSGRSWLASGSGEPAGAAIGPEWPLGSPADGPVSKPSAWLDTSGRIT